MPLPAGVGRRRAAIRSIMAALAMAPPQASALSLKALTLARMKPGRNDPCLCGSGKKYKHCCLGRDSVSVVDLADRTWRQMREAIDGYAAEMLHFIGQCYGQDA